MPKAEDAIRRFLEGDQEAFSQIVREWERRIYNLALRFLGNREDAQDAVQDTFISVFKSLPSLRDPGSFPTWLYRITLNHCRMRWRNRDLDVSLDEPISGEDDGSIGSLKSDTGNAHCADRLVTVDLIRKALMGLSEEHRSAIILKEYLGLSLEEVSNVMKCPLSTAKSRLYHGLREVQRNLQRLGAR
jgi:RNA polymerase sigma-70 factor (ECF subfamily)